MRCDPDQTSWAGCPEKDDVVGSNPPTSNCKCSQGTTLFQDKPVLENIASLPLSRGGTISWFPKHAPTETTVSTDVSSTTSRQETPSTTLSAVSSSDHPAETTTTPTPTSSTTAPPVAGLSVGEKAGIGIGSAFGAIVIGCLIAIAVILQRRKAKKKEISGPQPTLPITEPDPIQHDTAGPASSVLNGFKAELPADEPRSASTMAPSSIHSSPTHAQSPENSPSLRQYQPYRPGAWGDNRYSTVSEMSSGTHGYSESLVSALSPPPPGEPRGSATERSKTDQPDTIYEVQG